MAREIEDKYLVSNSSWRSLVCETTDITQTYLILNRLITIRTRIESDRPAILCIKLPERADGTPEYEWRIPAFFARWCSAFKRRTLHKHRHRVPWGRLTIEVDEFLDGLSGLVMAEVELPVVDFPYERPEWFGRDVTRDRRYKNALLVRCGIPQ